MKIYERTIPNRMMSDGLKNNHLEEAALSLVCSVDDIENAYMPMVIQSSFSRRNYQRSTRLFNFRN